MSKQSGAWLPYELNSDKKHDCRTKTNNNNNNNNQQEDKKQEKKFDHNDVRTLEHVLAELRLIGIEIDVDKLLGSSKDKEERKK